MPSSDNPLLFRSPARRISRRNLRAYADQLRRSVARGRTFNCLLTDDRELRRLNQRFLGRDYPTDVLSFPVAEPGETLGDLAISLDRARAQAREFGHTLEDEVRILMLHGLLHLVGLDHERDSGRMARVESRWRRRLELPTGLIERVSA